MGTIAEMLERRGREQGVIIGEQQGIQQGKVENAREMVIDLAGEQYGPLPASLEEDIRAVQSVTTLKTLGRQVLKLDNIEDFIRLVKKALEK